MNKRQTQIIDAKEILKKGENYDYWRELKTA